jgi:hypothetical protein
MTLSRQRRRPLSTMTSEYERAYQRAALDFMRMAAAASLPFFGTPNACRIDNRACTHAPVPDHPPPCRIIRIFVFVANRLESLRQNGTLCRL